MGENLCCENVENLKMDFSSLLNSDINEHDKITILYVTLKILEEFHTYFHNLPSCVEIFSPVFKYLEAISMDNYPALVRDAHRDLLNILKSSRDERKLHYIVMRALKPKALRMLEPKIEEV